MSYLIKKLTLCYEVKYILECTFAYSTCVSTDRRLRLNFLCFITVNKDYMYQLITRIYALCNTQMHFKYFERLVFLSVAC